MFTDIKFTLDINGIPEYIALDLDNDGTKNCLALVCKDGCNLTDHDCNEQLRKTCSSTLNVSMPSSEYELLCPYGSSSALYYMYNKNPCSDYPCYLLRYLCHSNTKFRWNTTDGYHCNKSAENEIHHALRVLRQLHDRSLYTPASSSKPFYYWIGEGRYTCDSSKGFIFSIIEIVVHVH